MTKNHCCNNFLRLLIFPLIMTAFLICSFILHYCQAQITLDGSMGTSGPLAGPDYNVTSDLGQIHGSNLFHSFGEFNVQTGESATFSRHAIHNSISIANILSRVTGGNQSFIDGTLASTIPGANLYLLNPAGVLFGANASLNVQGSFHVSTADYLRFGDGAEFHADLSKGSALTVVPVAAFGFLGDNPVSITIQESTLEVPEGKTLSVIGGDINIDGGTLNAPSGRINIASVASQGEVIPNTSGDSPDLKVDSFERLGKITLTDSPNSQAYVNTYGNPGGTVVIRGGRLTVENSFVWSDTEGADNGSEIGIDIDVSEDLIVTDESAITTDNVSGAGNAGNIKIKAGNLKMTGNNRIGSISWGTGNSGNVTVTTSGNLEMNSGPDISTHATWTGNARDINIEAGNLKMTGNPDIGSTRITSASWAAGKGGNVTVTTTGNLEITNGNTEISTLASGSGAGGDLKVEADSVYISGNSASKNPLKWPERTGLLVGAGNGVGGNLDLKANNVHVTNKGIINATSWGTGNAGNIYMKQKQDGGNLLATGGGIISSTSDSSGNRGIVDITMDNVTLSGVSSEPINNATGKLVLLSSGIIAQTFGGEGKGKDVRIKAKHLRVSDGATIDSRTAGKRNAGDIDITADKILITGVDAMQRKYVTDDLSSRSRIQSETSGLVIGEAATGDAGEIRINSKDVQIFDGGLINSETTSPGKGGIVDIKTDRLTLSNDAQIIAVSDASRSSKVSKAGNAGHIKINTLDTFQSNNSLISTSAENAKGGDISVTAGQDVLLSNGAYVSAESFGAGNAGNISIRAGHTYLSENSSVTTNAKQADGGNIEVNAQYMISMINSDIKASVGGGPLTAGGNISIDPEYVILKNSSILANAFLGQGGNIQIYAGTFLADPNSVISASSSLGIDGKVNINSPINVINGNIVQLHNNYSSAASLLHKSCAVRMSGGKNSSLIVTGRNVLPVHPGDLLPSPIYTVAMAEADEKLASLSEEPALSYGMNYFAEKGLLPLDMLDDESGCLSCPE